MGRKKEHTIREKSGEKQGPEQVSGKQVNEEKHNQQTNYDVAKDNIPATVDDFGYAPAVPYFMEPLLVNKYQP